MKNIKRLSFKQQRRIPSIIKKTLGTPGRVLKTDFALDIIDRESKGATYEDLKDMISGESNLKYIYDGNVEEGIGWAGQVIGLINHIPTVQELFDEMIQTADTGLKTNQSYDWRAFL